MQRDLEGLTLVVTGGAGALGGAVVQELTAAGATVVVPCIDDGPATQVPGARYVPRIDLSQESVVNGFYEALPSLWASVHLAGGFTWAKIEATTLAVAQGQWTMNAVTCLVCSRAAVAKIRASGTSGGRIVNVTARGAIVPTPGLTAYAMSKAAVTALTQTLAEELRDESILVNAIAPGIIDTPANRSSMPDADHTRWTRPVEIARTIHALVSPDISATSGAVVPVYGRS